MITIISRYIYCWSGGHCLLSRFTGLSSIDKDKRYWLTDGGIVEVLVEETNVWGFGGGIRRSLVYICGKYNGFSL